VGRLLTKTQLLRKGCSFKGYRLNWPPLCTIKMTTDYYYLPPNFCPPNTELCNSLDHPKALARTFMCP